MYAAYYFQPEINRSASGVYNRWLNAAVAAQLVTMSNQPPRQRRRDRSGARPRRAGWNDPRRAALHSRSNERTSA
jgi:capsid protein